MQSHGSTVTFDLTNMCVVFVKSTLILNFEFFMLSCFPGSVLEKAGGDEFKEEVKKLSESHGPLELTTG